MKIYDDNGISGDMKLGEIGFLNINTGKVYREFSSYYSRCKVKVILKSQPIWIDNVQTVKYFLETCQ